MRHPLARKDRLVIREVEGEVLVYDLARNRAFCLNPLAGAVWKHSDGLTSAARLAERISGELGATIDEQTVWSAIDRLGRDHLLEYCIPMPGRITRRQLAKAAAVAGPLVAALAMPAKADDRSCVPTGKPCSLNGPRCCNPSLICVVSKRGSGNGMCTTPS